MVIYEEIFKKNGLSKTQQEIIDLVGFKKTILEIGPSAGYMTKFFLKNHCIVDVVETNNNAVLKLPTGIRKTLNVSIEDNKIISLLSRNYDFIILADVLEHLINPEKTLGIIFKVADKKTKLIISMPNIASWLMRKQLFFNGNFEYQESGILDKTHLHFYTLNTLPKLLLETGWRVEKTKGTITRIPYEGLIRRLPILGFIFKKFFYQKIVEKFPNLTYYHFYIVAYKNHE